MQKITENVIELSNRLRFPLSSVFQKIEEVMAIMNDRHVRHHPVLSENFKQIGIIFARDLIKEVITERDLFIEQLESYIISSYSLGG
jgi:predicted transcriptional regulator